MICRKNYLPITSTFLDKIWEFIKKNFLIIIIIIIFIFVYIDLKRENANMENILKDGKEYRIQMQVLLQKQYDAITEQIKKNNEFIFEIAKEIEKENTAFVNKMYEIAKDLNIDLP